MDLLFVGEEHFLNALEVFERYDDHPLSFTDSTTVAPMNPYDVDHLLSFDTDFDGIVDRLGPGEVTSGSG